MSQPGLEERTSLIVRSGLDWDPTLTELASYLSGVHDLLYINWILLRRDSILSPYDLVEEHVQASKAALSFTVRRIGMRSPLWLIISSAATSSTAIAYAVLRLWEKFIDVRLKRSRAQLEMEINRQLMAELKTVESYYRELEESGRSDVRDPAIAAQNAAKALARVENLEIQP